MVTVTTRAALRAELARARSDAAVLGGGRVALVPTAGRLDEAHLRLVDAARRRADIVVTSIVNDARDPQVDGALARECGVHLLFAPDAAEMIPMPSRVLVTPVAFRESREGDRQADDLAAMLTTTAKLFHLVQPDVAVFGPSDSRDAALIRAMVTDLDMPIEIVVAGESAP
jgi:pantoate--beta-alanine ligase